jgi:hypothetical protein
LDWTLSAGNGIFRFPKAHSDALQVKKTFTKRDIPVMHTALAGTKTQAKKGTGSTPMPSMQSHAFVA